MLDSEKLHQRLLEKQAKTKEQNDLAAKLETKKIALELEELER